MKLKARIAFFTVLSLAWIMPIIIAILNSFKSNGAINESLFALPAGDSFVGAGNYKSAMTFGDYPIMKSFGYSVLISVASTTLIILCCSMAAWYIVRVNSLFSKIFYYMCMFSLAVPFQMVMFTLTSMAFRLNLDKPWTIPVVYLGFGAGVSIFMFSGFVKRIPYELEEAAIIDGCGAGRLFFGVVFPMMRPISISVGILQFMWIWNDYLLPYLVLDITGYRTIPIHIQYLKGSYGTVDLGASLAAIVLSLVPIMIVYILCQKYIVKGIAAGAVKG